MATGVVMDLIQELEQQEIARLGAVIPAAPSSTTCAIVPASRHGSRKSCPVASSKLLRIDPTKAPAGAFFVSGVHLLPIFDPRLIPIEAGLDELAPVGRDALMPEALRG